MATVKIDLAAEFTGKKAFKQAETTTEKLGKSVKSLAKTFGLAFGAAKVLAFAKASVQAAAKDEKAQKQLALALKNVGLGRDVASAEGYIQRLQSEFGVVDDKLRPAYQKLAVATRDTAQTQRLMQIALDISASTGKDLEAVTGALSKAYLGSNTALSKLGVGISKADLKSKSFKEITDKLAVTFAGAATTSANTFSGQIDKLAVATTNVKEIIGTSLINALTSLSTDKSMSNFAADMESAAKSLGNFIDSIVYLKGEMATIPGAGIVSGAIDIIGNILGRFSPQRAAELLKQIKGFQGMGNISTSVSSQDFQVSDNKAAQLAKDAAAKAAKAALALQKKSTKATQDQLKLAKAAAIFDLKRIQIAAALKGQISTEEQIRLELMMAIEDKNAAKADELTKKLADAQANNSKLADSISALPAAKDPYSGFNTGAISAILNIEALKSKVTELTGVALSSSAAMGSFAMGISQGLSIPDALSGARYAGQAANLYGLTDLLPPSNVPPILGTPTPIPSIPDPLVLLGQLDALTGSYPGGQFQSPSSNVPVAGATSGGLVPAGQGQISNTINLNVTGALDPLAVAAQIAAALGTSANTVGNWRQLGSGFKDVIYTV